MPTQCYAWFLFIMNCRIQSTFQSFIIQIYKFTHHFHLTWVGLIDVELFKRIKNKIIDFYNGIDRTEKLKNIN